MPGITDYERGLIGEFFRKANAIRGKAKLRLGVPKTASQDRTPMLSQLGRILKESGITHVKPAEIVKRVLAKATPVSAETIRKVSGSPASTLDAGLWKAALLVPRIGLGEAKRVVLKHTVTPRVGAPRGARPRTTLGLDKPTSEEKSFLEEIRSRAGRPVGVA